MMKKNLLKMQYNFRLVNMYDLWVIGKQVAA